VDCGSIFGSTLGFQCFQRPLRAHLAGAHSRFRSLDPSLGLRGLLLGGTLGSPRSLLHLADPRLQLLGPPPRFLLQPCAGLSLELKPLPLRVTLSHRQLSSRHSFLAPPVSPVALLAHRHGSLREIGLRRRYPLLEVRG
jgi:hypothetical protein